MLAARPPRRFADLLLVRIGVERLGDTGPASAGEPVSGEHQIVRSQPHKQGLNH
jgi:hypothetical protein